MDNSCRSCLKTAESFNYVMNEHLNPRQYYYCTSIEVNCNDNLPKTLCDNCFHQINQFTAFKTMCIKSENKLHRFWEVSLKDEPSLDKEVKPKTEKEISWKWLNENESSNKKMWSDWQPISDNTKKENKVNDLSNNELSFEFTSVTEKSKTDEENKMSSELKDVEICIELKNEIDNSMGNGMDEVFNDYENELTSTDAQEKVLSVHIPIENNLTPVIASVKKPTTRKPSKAKSSTTRKPSKAKSSTTRKPSKAKRPTTRKPSKAKRNTTLKPSKVKRIRKITQPNREFRCNQCKQSFSYKERLEGHILSKHEGKPARIECKTCNKVFAKWTTLKTHINSVHSEYSFKDVTCPICSKVTKNPTMLKSHMYRIHKNPTIKKQICDECGQIYSSVAGLQIHQLTHKSNQIYPCGQCDKKYTRKHSLITHVHTIHSGKQFTCDYCGHTFTRKSNLIDHIRIHERSQHNRYICEICSRSLCSRKSLRRHKLIHSGEKPFPCDYCEKSFRDKSILAIHERQHTGEKPTRLYECTLCEIGFKRRYTLLQHNKQRHEENQQCVF